MEGKHGLNVAYTLQNDRFQFQTVEASDTRKEKTKNPKPEAKTKKNYSTPVLQYESSMFWAQSLPWNISEWTFTQNLPFGELT